MTDQMIYAKEATAKQIATKLSNAGTEHMVVPLPQGFQVAPVTKVKADLPAEKPAPVAPKPTKAEEVKTDGPTFRFQLYNDAPKNIVVVGKSDGQFKWIHKSNVLFASDPDLNGFVEIKLTQAYADRYDIDSWAATEEDMVEKQMQVLKDRKDSVVGRVDDVLIALKKGVIGMMVGPDENGEAAIAALPGVFERALAEPVPEKAPKAAPADAAQGEMVIAH